MSDFSVMEPLATPPPLLYMYHAVQDLPQFPICVSPRRLREQLDWFAGQGLQGVSVRELLAARSRGEGHRLIGLTFDDGYRDFLDEAVPMLQERGFTATLYVVAGKFGGSNDWDEAPRLSLLSAAEIAEIAAAGFEVGSHSLTHARLSDLPAAKQEREVRVSREVLAAVLGEAPVGFCYPYGAYDSHTVAAVEAAGYAYACATKSYGDAGPLTLPRVYIGEQDRPWRLRVGRWVHTASARLGRDLR